MTVGRCMVVYTPCTKRYKIDGNLIINSTSEGDTPGTVIIKSTDKGFS